MSEKSVEAKYRDQTVHSEQHLGELRGLRQKSAIRDLRSMLPDIRKTTPAHIIEIGSGIGGVTAGLRELFPHPELRISTVDADSREWVRRSARDHQTTHYEEDITTLTPEALAQRIQGADLIVALRTSGHVAKYLLETLPKTDFEGDLVFSLFAETDTIHMRDIAGFIINNNGRIFSLIEMRGANEVSYVLSFPLVGEAEVA